MSSHQNSVPTSAEQASCFTERLEVDMSNYKQFECFIRTVSARRTSLPSCHLVYVTTRYQNNSFRILQILILFQGLLWKQLSRLNSFYAH
jgi:hypothetical protein